MSYLSAERGGLCAGDPVPFRCLPAQRPNSNRGLPYTVPVPSPLSPEALWTRTAQHSRLLVCLLTDLMGSGSHRQDGSKDSPLAALGLAVSLSFPAGQGRGDGGSGPRRAGARAPGGARGGSGATLRRLCPRLPAEPRRREAAPRGARRPRRHRAGRRPSRRPPPAPGRQGPRVPQRARPARPAARPAPPPPAHIVRLGRRRASGRQDVPPGEAPGERGAPGAGGSPAAPGPGTQPRASPQTPLQPGQPFKFSILEVCDRIKEEFQFLQAQYHSLKLECEKLASEKTEMQRHYVMYYEMSYGLNIEMHKQAEIVKRLSGICAQIIPFLTQEHQQQVLQAVERAKQVTVGELNSLIGQLQPPSHHAPPVPLTPRPAGLVGSSATGLLALSGALAAQAQLAAAAKEDRAGAEAEGPRVERAPSRVSQGTGAGRVHRPRWGALSLWASGDPSPLHTSPSLCLSSFCNPEGH
ncbi:Hypothetical predicted protein [Marmota monax]|uniref:Groucho/TLE N-terminal Q-rich domain-containing protein n=1 Tax=Marmota monax TaxID=9995 RepID=A0A5E4BUZ8_MARMO|nr:Hypothetical predicted protein [Marmota monax]